MHVTFISFECHVLIFLHVMNPTYPTHLSDLTSEFRETSKDTKFNKRSRTYGTSELSDLLKHFLCATSLNQPIRSTKSRPNEEEEGKSRPNEEKDGRNSQISNF